MPAGALIDIQINPFNHERLCECEMGGGLVMVLDRDLKSRCRLIEYEGHSSPG